jgi:hypothetical protein
MTKYNDNELKELNESSLVIYLAQISEAERVSKNMLDIANKYDTKETYELRMALYDTWKRHFDEYNQVYKDIERLGLNNK